MIRKLAILSVVIGLVILGGALTACGGSEPPESLPPTPSEQRIKLESEIAAWDALNIDSYQVRVTYRKRGWDPHVMDLRVDEGTASFEDFGCFPEQTCFERELDPQRFTLDAIFNDALNYADFSLLNEYPYNADYGFPRIINAGEEAWEISNFRPLE